MSLINACSERCGWCGRCDKPEVRSERHAYPSREDYQAIHRGFVRVGLDRDYFGWEDIDYLWKQGQRVEQIIATALEHQDRERRFMKGA